jgi:ADP-heptose:LPS heptosyltransferase
MRMLVVRTDFLGDSVLSSTFIRMLKQLPNVQIDVLCYEYNFVAFQYNKHIEHTYCLYKTSDSDEQIISNQQVLIQLKQNKYTAVFMLNRDLKTYKSLKYVNCTKVFGHKLGVKSMRSKIFCRLTGFTGKYHYLPYDNSIHEVVNQYNLLNFGLQLLNISKSIALDNHCYFYTANFNPDEPHKLDSETIVINISGRHESLKYIPSSLARCIIEDLIKLNHKVLIIATNDDMSRAQNIIAEFNNQQVELYTESDLFNVADTMAKYQYYIGADGGLLHIAAGLHMRCIGLFHAQNINAWHPWSPNQICLQTTTRKIYDLTAHDVIAAFKELEMKYASN